MPLPPRPPLVPLATLVALLTLATGGCKKPFEPGVYDLTGVYQIARDTEGEEVGRTSLRLVGSARWTFDYDGELLVEYSNYGVGFERPCSGHYRGSYGLQDQQIRLQVKRAALPAYCRPEQERIFQWQRGWGGTVTLEVHWEGNQYLAYRLEPSE